MMSNKGLNSKEALDESTATNSSVTLSGIRREKGAPTDLDIEEYSRNQGNSDPPFAKARARQARQRTAVTCHESLPLRQAAATHRAVNLPGRVTAFIRGE